MAMNSRESREEAGAVVDATRREAGREEEKESPRALQQSSFTVDQMALKIKESQHAEEEEEKAAAMVSSTPCVAGREKESPRALQQSSFTAEEMAFNIKESQHAKEAEEEEKEGEAASPSVTPHEPGREEENIRPRSFEELCASLPKDLAVHIFSFLPSPLLFECRRFSLATKKCAMSTLARRPFFVYQVPSSLCYLLPLDAPSTPIPCSFKLGISSFQLDSTSSNLLCLCRRYQHMFDISVCSIFCRWKVTVPPIVHPSYAPRLLRRIFLEDSNVDSLNLIWFEALPISDDDPHACPCCLGSHEFRIFVGNNTYVRVFDSRQQQWTDPAYNRTDIVPPSPGKFMVSGLPTSINFESSSFKLSIRLPHVEGNCKSDATKGLVLQKVCSSDRDPHIGPKFCFQISDRHQHTYRRQHAYSSCHRYKGKLYLLLAENEVLLCQSRDNPMRQRNVLYHDMPTDGLFEKYLCPELGSNLECHRIFPATSPYKLTMYVAHIDTTDWTMHLDKENASALLQFAGMSKVLDQFRHDIGTFLFIDGEAFVQ